MLNFSSAGIPIPDEVLDRPIAGLHLSAGTLREELRSPRLLVFLRHFG